MQISKKSITVFFPQFNLCLKVLRKSSQDLFGQDIFSHAKSVIFVHANMYTIGSIGLSGTHEGTGAELKYSSNFQTIKTIV